MSSVQMTLFVYTTVTISMSTKTVNKQNSFVKYIISVIRMNKQLRTELPLQLRRPWYGEKVEK